MHIVTKRVMEALTIMAKLDQLAKCALKDMEYTLNREMPKFKNAKKSYKIIACGGDHSVGGMGRKAKTYDIPLNKVHDVDVYIDMCEHFSDYAMMATMCKSVKSKFATEVVYKHLGAQDLVQDIFEDKWDYRTQWCWVEFPEVA